MVISYMISAFAALLAALCYTEFVVDLPLAGGAFNYISLVFGELVAWYAPPSPPLNGAPLGLMHLPRGSRVPWSRMVHVPGVSRVLGFRTGHMPRGALPSNA